MLSRFSVKHPYLIVVAVIICLILGGVSLTKMKTDLMPDMTFPTRLSSPPTRRFGREGGPR